MAHKAKPRSSHCVQRNLAAPRAKAITCAIAAAFASISVAAYALPTGGKVTAGSAAIQQSGSNLTISQASDRAAIDWLRFSIGATETVRFNQPRTSSIALNRVLGQDPSQIFGSLSANGQVFLLNPNGVLFAQGAQVNVGGLVASTLNMSNANFMAGRYEFTKGTSAGSVINQGTLNAVSRGYVALLGPQVKNEGVITATLGTVALAAGDQITLNLNGNSLVSLVVNQGAVDALAQNSQLIRANGGTVILTAKAADHLAAAVVNNQGVIEARTLVNQAGKIKLLGDMEVGVVNVTGRLDASAPNGGDGGFIETSAAKVTIADSARITTAAPAGNTGTWLIDPPDFKIARTGGDITGAALGTNLNTSNVAILSSNGATPGNGDIFVNDAVSWSANNTLTLTAARDININSAITATGNRAGLVITPGAVGRYRLASTINLPGTTPRLTIEGKIFTVINSVTALQNMTANTAGNYAIGRNINAAATANWNVTSGVAAGFVPVGNDITNFSGTFDGLGHTITGLTVNRPGTDYVGLFGISKGTIRNVGVAGGSVTGRDFVGPLAGWNERGIIENAFATARVRGQSHAGGLVGYSSGDIMSVYATGAVTGVLSAGGLVGWNDHGIIRDARATGAVQGDTYVGGLVGFSSGDITNAHATGRVTGNVAAGGVAGWNDHGLLNNVYATGAVTANNYAGGLVGFSSGTITNAYATGAVTGTRSAGGLLGWNDHGLLASDYATGTVRADEYAGGLVGYSSGTIANSYATGPVTGILSAGGLAGWNDHGTLSGVRATGTVLGQDYAGGLVGFSSGDISNSHAIGRVTGTLSAGGLLGWNDHGTLMNDFATGAVSGVTYTGGLVGFSSGTISNAYASGPVTGNLAAGGLVGWNDHGTLSFDYATGNVTGQRYVGGLAGFSSGTITNAYASGAVTGDLWAGGLAGWNEHGTITRAYATGAVRSLDTGGGLVGINSGTISETYATGAVSATWSVGGLVGWDDRGLVNNSYWDINTTGQATSPGGGTGLPTADMMKRASFATWDFDNVWRIQEGQTYPTLRSFAP